MSSAVLPRVIRNSASRAGFTFIEIIIVVAIMGILAAVIGPELAKQSAGLLDGARFAGSYLAVAGLAAAAVLCIRFIDIPPPGEEERSGAGRPLREIVAQPTFLIAVLAAMVGYGSMSFVMTAIW